MMTNDNESVEEWIARELDIMLQDWQRRHIERILALSYQRKEDDAKLGTNKRIPQLRGFTNWRSAFDEIGKIDNS